MQGCEFDALIAVRRGISCGYALRNGLHIGSSSVERRAGAEAAEHPNRMPDSRLLRRLIEQRERQPYFAIRGEGGILWKHANDVVGGAVERDGAADGLTVASKVSGPRRCADYRDMVFARIVILLIEQTTGQRGNAQQREEIPRCEHTP